jgi:hypothetical protein
VSVTRLLRLASLVLAICVAVGGQVRAVDLVDLDDSNPITAQTSDAFIATTTGKAVEPPGLGGAILAFPVTIGSGRTAIVELFRPPQLA